MGDALAAALGATLMAAALLLAVWAGWKRYRVPHLVDDGPYAWSRHPQHLAIVLAGCGAALLWQLPLLAVAAGLWVWVAQRWLIPAEEARLARAYGGWWRDYAASVRPWI